MLHAAKAKKRIAQELDDETERMRALWDAKGTTIRQGITYKGNGSIVPWEIRRSFRGRTDQFDVVVNKGLLFTGGVRRLREEYNIRLTDSDYSIRPPDGPTAPKSSGS